MKSIALMLVLLICPAVVHAEIYKYVDADGHVTYSNVPTKGSHKLNLDPAPEGGGVRSVPRPRASATPSGFPRVDQGTQRQRDDKRQEILSNELATERKALDEAKKNFSEGESTPEVFRGRDGKTYRNMGKYDEKMQQLQKEVDLHQKNVDLLEKEIGPQR